MRVLGPEIIGAEFRTTRALGRITLVTDPALADLLRRGFAAELAGMRVVGCRHGEIISHIAAEPNDHIGLFARCNPNDDAKCRECRRSRTLVTGVVCKGM